MPRLATGMLVRIVDTSDVGTLIQIRESSQTCVIKLTNGTLKKNVPLDDVKEVRDGGDGGATTNSAKSPIRLAANEPLLALPSSSSASPSAAAKSPTKRNHTTTRKMEVGDAVRARYKKGAKWFTGKILKVRMDGTYDVQYDDGDVEMKVEDQYVEAAAGVTKQDQHEKPPKLQLSLSPVKSPVSNSGGVRFAVGDKIKARYKKGNKLFAGKITKAHADGTFDVRYDDGDVETRVEASYIQSERNNSKDDDDSETPRVASPSAKSSSSAKKTRMDDLEVGDAVKARYKKGTKLFAGKITRAHADGTFDIRYDDGELETRVAVQYIEPQERAATRDDTSSSSPKKSVSKPLQSQRRIGDKVKARYKKGAKFFSGTVTKVHADGSMDIRYEDGDTESRVDARYVESMDGSDTEDESMMKKKKTTWRVDDPVMAKYKKGKKLYAGVVKRVHSDGTFDIRYEDGDVETRVEPQYMEVASTPVTNSTMESPSKKKTNASAFEVGDKVKARYKGGAKLFAGTVVKSRTDGTYDIRYDDGDVETHVEPRHIEAVDDPKRKPNNEELRLDTGDRVLARYKKGAKSFPGRVGKTHADGTYDIKYDDGETETRVQIQYIERQETSTTTNNNKREPERQLLRVGDSVKARYKKGTKYFNGKIKRVRTDGTFDVEYDDGDVELQVAASYIELLETEKPKSPIKKPTAKKKSLEVGDHVKARYKKGAKLFRGVVKRVRSDGSYDIKYEDGDVETSVEIQYIERDDEELSDNETKNKTKTKIKTNEPSLLVGDAVKARYKNSQKWYAGRISRVRGDDATYDIEYDDGELELRVTADKIEPVAGNAKTKAKTKTQKEIRVGDAVKARYKGGKKLYAAEITRVRPDGTFDVQYEDGDVEIRLNRELIECPGDDAEEEETTTSKQRALAVGDVVLAQYKGGKKMFQGRITRVRANGSCDIEYDDGDTEQSVAADKIQRVESPKKTKQEEEDEEELVVGDAVQAYYKRGKKLFTGKILRCHSDGVFDIQYDDGDVEKRMERKWIVVDTKKTKAKTKTKRLSVGDAVKATHRRSGARRVRGRITRERSDGTFDIEFTDGETATRVEQELIEVDGEEEEEEERRGRKAAAFEDGDAVSARYKGGLKWYDGKVKRVRSDGSVDIRYEDGDVEERVAPANVRRREDDTHRPSSSATKTKATTKTTKTTLSKGDVVEVDPKQRGRYKRAIVVRVHRGDGHDENDLDGFVDVQYDDSGEVERRVARRLVRVVDVREEEETEKKNNNKKKNKDKPRNPSSDSEESGEKTRRRRDKPKASASSSSSSSSSDSSSNKKNKHKTKIKSTKHKIVKGCRVTMRKAVDATSRRVGRVRKVHSDGSCDVVYATGDAAKRLPGDALLVCSDSENDDDDNPKSNSNRRVGLFMRNQSVLACWRRATRMAKPTLCDRWEDAVVLARSDDDGTYSIRYRSGEMEENVPEEALKLRDDASPRATQRPAAQLNQERDLSDSDVVFLLEQLAMTLYEEGEQKKKPQLRFSDDATNGSGSGSGSSSSDDSNSSGSGSGDGSSSGEEAKNEESKTSSSKENKKKNKKYTKSSTTKKNTKKKTKGSVEKAIHRLFDSKLLKKYNALFDQHDTDHVGRITKSKFIRIVEQLCSTTTTASDTSNSDTTVRRHLSDWFATQDSLRTHSKFDFTTLLVAFAVVKHHLSTLLIQQNMANALNARFASHHESQRQLELWQQKLGFRTFELLQRSFTDSAVPRMFPAQVRVRELAAIFDHVTRSAVPSKPLEVFLSQMKLLPHHTLHLPAFLCCFYQLYGSAPAFHHHNSHDGLTSTGNDALELRPVAFVASCLFSNGDACCARHGDLVRRLSIGRTPAQVELVLRFREVFESLQDSSTGTTNDSDTISSSQLDAFAAGVVRDPSVLSPFLQALRKRTAAVSLVELFATCGFVIDELTAAPTVTNAIDKMRLRADATQVRRIVTLVRSMCLKVLRFPNNPDYWRIRCNSPAFHAKLGRVHGATSLLEAVGFVEYGKTHLELRGARSLDGRRQAVSSLPKTTLDTLRDACGELDAELSVMDGVESVVSILQRIAAERRHETPLSLEECGDILRNLVAYVENVLKNPKDSRCWRIRETNKTFQRQIGYLPFHADLMASIGYDVASSGSSQGSVFVLRGTGLSSTSSTTQPTAAATATSTAGASLANFAFSSVSSQMEWFLWRRKQEMESLLQDDMEYLVQMLAPSTASSSDQQSQSRSNNSRLVSSSSSSGKMYPYGRNALEIFSQNAAQKTQLAMMKRHFESLDTKQSGFLRPEELLAQQFTSYSRRWAAFECFDLDGDSRVDLADFVGALGPALDHAFHPLNVTACVPFHKMTLSEQLSTLVGRVRLTVTVAEATAVLDAVINCVGRIVDQPDVVELREIHTKSTLAGFATRLPVVKELLHLAGYRTPPPPAASPAATATVTVDVKGSSMETVAFVLQPQSQQNQVRFQTNKTTPPATAAALESVKPLDPQTLGRLQLLVAMLSGHARLLVFPAISDVGAVARAIGEMRPIAAWLKLTELAVLCLDNVLTHADDELRYRQLKTTTQTFTSVVAAVAGGVALFVAIGFRETDRGTLLLPEEITREQIQARKLELEVGGNALRIVDKMNKQETEEDVFPRTLSPGKGGGGGDTAAVDYYKRKALAAELAREEAMRKSAHLEKQLEIVAKTKSTTGVRRGGATASAPSTPTSRSRAEQQQKQQKQQRQGNTTVAAGRVGSPRARAALDTSGFYSIETEILAQFSPRKRDADHQLEQDQPKMRSSQSTRGANQSSNRQPPPKSTQRRTPNSARAPATTKANSTTTAALHESSIAMDSHAGSCAIVVRSSSSLSLQPGALVRVGVENRDLTEERLITHVDHTTYPAMAKLILHAPLQFPHFAKDLVFVLPSKVVDTSSSSSGSSARRLILADLEMFLRETVLDEIMDRVVAQHSTSSAGSVSASNKTPTAHEIQSGDLFVVEKLQLPRHASVSAGGFCGEQLVVAHPCTTVPRKSDTSTIFVFRDIVTLHKLRAVYEGLLLQCADTKKKWSPIFAAAVRKIPWLAMHEPVIRDLNKTSQEPLTWPAFLQWLQFPLDDKPTTTTEEQDQDDPEKESAEQLLALTLLRPHFRALMSSSRLDDNGVFSIVDTKELVKRAASSLLALTSSPSGDSRDLTVVQTLFSELLRLYDRGNGVSWPEIVYCIRHAHTLQTPELFPVAPHTLDISDETQPSRAVAAIVCARSSPLVFVLFMDGYLEVWRRTDASSKCVARILALFPTSSSSSSVSSSTAHHKSTSPQAHESFVEDYFSTLAHATRDRDWLEHQRQRTHACLDGFLRPSASSKTNSSSPRSLLALTAYETCVVVNASMILDGGLAMFQLDGFYSLRPLQRLRLESCSRTVKSKSVETIVKSSGVIETFAFCASGERVAFTTLSSSSGGVLWIADGATGAIIACVDEFAWLHDRSGGLCFGWSDADDPLLYVAATRASYVSVWQRHHQDNEGESKPKTKKSRTLRRVATCVLADQADDSSTTTIASTSSRPTSSIASLAISAGAVVAATSDGSLVVWTIHSSTLRYHQLPVKVRPAAHVQQKRGTTITDVVVLTADYDVVYRPQYPDSGGCRIPDNEERELQAWDSHLPDRCVRLALYLLADGELVSVPVAAGGTRGFSLGFVTLNDVWNDADNEELHSRELERVLLQPESVLRVLLLACEYLRDGVFAQKSVSELLQDLQTSKILYGTHTQIQNFVAGYKDSVRMEMRCYYRKNDSADSLSPLSSSPASRSSPPQAGIPRPQSLLVGVVMVTSIGPKQQTEGNNALQLWSFASAPSSTAKAQSDAATRQLRQRATWQLEAFRIRRQRALVASTTQRNRVEVRRRQILTDIKRLLLATVIHDHIDTGRELHVRVEDAVLAKVEQLCRLTALEMRSRTRGDPVERYLRRLLSHGSAAATLVETLREAEGDCALAFRPWLQRLRTELLSEGLSSVTLEVVIRLIRRWRRKFLSFASLCDVVSELGLLVDQTSLLQQFCAFALSKRTATTATASRSDHASADSEYHTLLTSIHPRLAVEFLLKTCDVGDRIEKCIDVLADRTLQKPPPQYHQKDRRSSATAEQLYAQLLQRRRLTKRLCAIEQRQLACQHNNSDNPQSHFMSHVSHAARQSLKRILKTSLPSVSPDVVSVTICVPVELRRLGNHVVVVRSVGADPQRSPARVPLSVVFFPSRDVRLVQRECAFYRRVQPFKTRELFLPVVPSASDLPLLKSEHLMPLIDQETVAMHVICETLGDWRTLRQSLQYLHKRHHNHCDQLNYWQQLIAFWCRQVLLALVVLEEQGQLQVESLDLDDVLVSPDGSQLRVATLQLTPQDRTTATDHIAVFGAFVVQLCEGFSAPEHHQHYHKPTNDYGRLRTMQQRVWELWLHAEGDNDDDPASQQGRPPPPSLSATDFVDFTQQHARSANASLARVVAVGLLALQPPGLHTRADLASSLWALAFYAVAEDAPTPLATEFAWRVGLQSQLEQLVLVPLNCLDDESGGTVQCTSVDALTAATLLKTTATHINTLLCRLLTLTTTEDWQRDLQCDFLHSVSTNRVLLRLACVAIGVFEKCLRVGQRDAAHGVIQSTLQLLRSLLTQVEATVTLAMLLREPSLQQLICDVVHALCTMCGAPLGTTAKPSPAIAAALWRLSESTLKDLIGSETNESKASVYPTTLHFLQATRASLVDILPVEADPNRAKPKTASLLTVWWHQREGYARTHQMLPQCTPCVVVTTSSFVSLAYLKAVYQTLEVRFNVSSATTTTSSTTTTAMTTKFRLAALQSFVSPAFLDRHSHPHVAIAQELTARVWLDLEIAATLCDLLRDSDDRVVFSALSILDAYTRVLRCHSDEVFVYRPKVSAQALAYQLASQYQIQTEVAGVITRLVRVLKIQGEAGTNATLSSRYQSNNYPNTSGTSRVQVTPVALLSVAMAFLVNCTHGGDACTQHWVSSGLSTLVLTHAKARSLAFVTLLETNWMSSSATVSSSASPHLRSVEKSSPFELLVRQIAAETATRNVLLVQHWRSSSSYFRQLIDSVDANPTVQLVVTAGREFGKLVHLWDTLQDVNECDGTLEERQHALQYAVAVLRVWLVCTEDLCCSTIVHKCCRVAWSWMETSWRALSLHQQQQNTMRDHAAIVTGGLRLVETIAQSDAISSLDLQRLMSAADDQDDHEEDATPDESVVARLVQWLQRTTTIITTSSSSHPSVSYVVCTTMELLLTLVDPTASTTATEQRARVILQQSVGLAHILRLLQTDVLALSRGCGSLAYAVQCKRRLWAALLAQCGDRDVARGVVHGGLMDYWLGELFDQDVQLQPPQQEEENNRDHDDEEEDGVAAVNARLEVVGYLELLVFYAQTSGLAQVQLLTTDVLKCVLHHRTIQNEKQRALTYTQFSRTSRTHHHHAQSTLAHRMVATAKRVVQLVCCLATELLATTSGLDTAVAQVLRGAGVSRFVLDWHQQSEPCVQETLEETTRVSEFWDLWPEESASVHGHASARRQVMATTITTTTSVAATTRQPRRQYGGSVTNSTVVSAAQVQVQANGTKQETNHTSTVAPQSQQLLPRHGQTVLLPSRVPLDELLVCLGDEIARLKCVFQRHAVRCGPRSRTEKLLAASRLAAACRDCNIPPHETHNHNHNHDDDNDNEAKDALTFSQFLQEYAHRSGLQDLIQQQIQTAPRVSFVWLACGQWVSVATSQLAELESAFRSRATTTSSSTTTGSRSTTLSVDHVVELLQTLHRGVFARQELRTLVVEELRCTPTTHHTPVELAAVTLRDLRRAFAVVSRQAAARPALTKLLLLPPPPATRTTERGAIPISPVRVTTATSGPAATLSPTRAATLSAPAAATEQTLRGSVVQTLMSIDMDSARALEKQKQKQRQTRAQNKNKNRNKNTMEENRIAEPKHTRGTNGGGGGDDDESIGSDAYSPFCDRDSSALDSGDVESLASKKKKKTKKIKRTKTRVSAKETKEEEEEEEGEEMKRRASDSEKSSSSSSSSSGSASSGRRGKSKNPNKNKKKKTMIRPPATAGVKQDPKQQQTTTLGGRQETALREIFAKYDVDGDGAIGFVDLRRVLGPSQLSNVELQRWIAEKDRRGVGAVDFDDFAFAFAATTDRSEPSTASVTPELQVVRLHAQQPRSSLVLSSRHKSTGRTMGDGKHRGYKLGGGE